MGSARVRGLLLVLAVAIAGVLTYLLTRPPRSEEGPSIPAADHDAATGPAPVQPVEASTPPAPPAPPEDPELGRRLFREACAWVAGGEPDIVAVADVHLTLLATAEGEERGGTVRLWLQGLESYRRDVDLGQGLTSLVLVRDALHERAASGRFRNAKRENDGAERLKRAQADRQRLIDLAGYLTLAGLDLPTATFLFEGEQAPTGRYARADGGTWAKVRRTHPGQPDLTFWLATERRRDKALHVTYPGVVRSAGDPAAGRATEDVLLGQWESAPGRSRRLPRTLRMLVHAPDGVLVEALNVTITDARINAGLDSEVFDVR